MLYEVITNSVNATVEAAKKRLNAWKIETESKIRLANQQMEALAKISGAMDKKSTGMFVEQSPVDDFFNLSHAGFKRTFDEKVKEKQDEINDYKLEINKINQDIQSITRITSYNVCYTKLLRKLISPPRSMRGGTRMVGFYILLILHWW